MLLCHPSDYKFLLHSDLPFLRDIIHHSLLEPRTRWFGVLAMPPTLPARLCSAVNAGGMGVKSRPANDRQAPADFLVVVQNLHARSELVCVGAQVHARYLRTPPQDALQLCGIRGRCGKYSKARPPTTCQISCQLFEAEPDQLLAGAGRSPFEEIISQRQRQGREGGAGCSVMSSEGRQTGGRPDLLPPCLRSQFGFVRCHRKYLPLIAVCGRGRVAVHNLRFIRRQKEGKEDRQRLFDD